MMSIHAAATRTKRSRWTYIDRILAGTKLVSFLNPLKLLPPYKVQLLERCWQLEYENETESHRQLLERCWQLGRERKGYFRD
jgi:hypothetical protein